MEAKCLPRLGRGAAVFIFATLAAEEAVVAPAVRLILGG
jgi:hypothetical protein